MNIQEENGKFYTMVNGCKCECLPSGYLIDQDGNGWKVTFGKFFWIDHLNKFANETNTSCAQIMFKRFGFQEWMGKYIDGEEDPIMKKETNPKKKKYFRKVARIQKKYGFYKK